MLLEKEKTDAPAGKEEKATSQETKRTLLFLSHATPEDNGFASWLATQLANAGYEVWCDVTKLLGGEKFWDDITDAVENYTFRFLFASTLHSNRKQGALRELNMALKTEEATKIKDFIIPLKVDQFPFKSTQDSVKDRNFVRFDENWAAGLAQLLKLLERENTPRSPLAGPSCVSEWYQNSLDQNRKIVVTNERCYSNWFKIHLPKHIKIHQTSLPADTLLAYTHSLTYPHRIHGTKIITFAAAHEIEESLGADVKISKTSEVDTEDFIDSGNEDFEIASFDANNILNDIVRQAWENTITGQGLKSYELASGLKAWFFKKGHLEKDRAYFTAMGKRRTYRQLVGNKSKRNIEGQKLSDGHWHYAISASPQLTPFPRLVLRHHVVFTDDGETPWNSANRMHKARRSVCKQWWNREWRDRLFAFCSAIGNGQKELSLPVGQDAVMNLSTVPIVFTSPWSYFEDGTVGLNEEVEIELIEDDIEEDDDSEETE
jgi:hypothetical protein